MDTDSDSDSDEGFDLPDLSLVQTLTIEQALEQSESNPSRFSISAEVYGKYNKRSSFQPKFVPKDDDVCKRLRARLDKVWMFEKLVEEDKKTLIDTMREEKYSANDIIIMEGDKGNNLFIVEKGTFN